MSYPCMWGGVGWGGIRKCDILWDITPNNVGYEKLTLKKCEIWDTLTPQKIVGYGI